MGKRRDRRGTRAHRTRVHCGRYRGGHATGSGREAARAYERWPPMNIGAALFLAAVVLMIVSLFGVR
jgi:hypothetical protein